MSSKEKVVKGRILPDHRAAPTDPNVPFPGFVWKGDEPNPLNDCGCALGCARDPNGAVLKDQLTFPSKGALPALCQVVPKAGVEMAVGLLPKVEAADVDMAAETFALVAAFPRFGFKGELLMGLDTAALGACVLRQSTSDLQM
ncbi:MAG: hypothetical protein Q9160_000356 [Pyrenula sp. 1 TL-2023]